MAMLFDIYTFVFICTNVYVSRKYIAISKFMTALCFWLLCYVQTEGDYMNIMTVGCCAFTRNFLPSFSGFRKLSSQHRLAHRCRFPFYLFSLLLNNPMPPKLLSPRRAVYLHGSYMSNFQRSYAFNVYYFLLSTGLLPGNLEQRPFPFLLNPDNDIRKAS